MKTNQENETPADINKQMLEIKKKIQLSGKNLLVVEKKLIDFIRGSKKGCF